MSMVVLWVLLSLIPAAVASSRGRSGVGMFVVSLVLSPLIGLVIALFLQPQAALNDQSARSGDSRTHRVCPSCAEVVRREAKTCKHCGHELPEPPPLPRVPDAVLGWTIIVVLVLLVAWWRS